MDITASLNSKTVAELRKLAASYDIAGRSTMKKSELVAVLAHDGLAELAIATENIDDAAQERFADQYRAAQKSDVVGDCVAAMIDQDAPERIRFDESPSVFEDAPPVRTYADGSQMYGPYVSATNEVAILRDAPGRAIVTAAFDGQTVGGSIVRIGRRYMLTAGLITIKANSLERVAKLFAKRLGFRADVIDIDRTVC